MRPEDTPPYGVPVQNDSGFAMLVAERLARIEALLEGVRQDREDDKKGRQDHEDRIRALERWRYMLPTSLIGALVSAGVTVYSLIGK